MAHCGLLKGPGYVLGAVPGELIKYMVSDVRTSTRIALSHRPYHVYRDVQSKTPEPLGFANCGTWPTWKSRFQEHSAMQGLKIAPRET
ncbi:hypothetical protein HPB50_019226 [Hyalomma asiaticum]|uniref:Uncharacterized protein n=1 Tax=Hyalomma asiaticum TaxID=266040 RepID=A0ACB7SWE8_HYAAI|nr:hypothetical protein HPB50_019226 [Hyalomma asiaticum]